MISTQFFWPSETPDQNKAVGDFVSFLTFGQPGVLRDFSSMAVVKDGVLIAGVLYQEYYAGSGTIEISAASSSKVWMTRKVIHDMFSMPFEKLGSHLVVVKTSERNTPVREISERVGLDRHYIPDLRGKGHGEYTYTMNRTLWESLPYSKAR